MALDPELTAMEIVREALAELDEDARRRVLGWAAERYEVDLGQASASRGVSAAAFAEADWIAGFSAFVDLFDAANPRTDAERALVGGYWFQASQSGSDFAAQAVNNELKDVGHGVGNITDALAKLQRRKPALVRQVAKSGKTQQARKRYKLTSAGIAAVERMLRGEGRDE